MSDRLPPYAPDAESAIIGCCLNFPAECVSECQRIITHEDFFYDHRNQVLWEIMNGHPVHQLNVVSVTGKLRDRELLDKIGVEYLSDCQDKGIGPSFLSGWLQEVQDKHLARQLMQKCSTIISYVVRAEVPIGINLDYAEREILGIRPKQTSSLTAKELTREALVKIEHRCENGNAITGLTTGFPDLDSKSDGLHAGEMVVVAGFPSTGKTALAVNIATTNALAKTPTAVFSAEMKPVQLVVRSICSEARVNFRRATYNDAPKFIAPAGKIANAPLFIEPASGMTIGQVMATARRLKQKHGIKIIVVDYIQLIEGTGDNREQQVADVAKGIKAMAMELDCAVLGLSQLTDDGKLRESRAISQHTDSIWKLENNGDWQPLIQPIKLHIEKCRDGETGTINLTFFKEFTRFESCCKVSDEDVPND